MTAPTKRSARQLKYGELDRSVVAHGLLRLARRVGVQQVTMRGLAVELGSSAPAVYYHVANKQDALDLLAETLLEQVEIPIRGQWERRLSELYESGYAVLVAVSGIATVLQTRPRSDAGRRLDEAALAILRKAGLDEHQATAAQTVLFTHLLGSVGLQHAVQTFAPDAARAHARHVGYGLRVIISGIKTESGLT